MSGPTPLVSGGLRMERSGGLAERAHSLLAYGPAATSVLAAQVLGLSLGGDPQAGARAVWTLLGSDSRFAVDADGVWSLRAEAASRQVALHEEEWVVVDVETTGGSPNQGDRVTEIAAVRVSGGEVGEVFTSLVNPLRPIPANIRALTGITDEMVADAPPFADLAAELAAFLEGGVFVAHNAPFDWRFVSSEMERTVGLRPAGRQLCTVKLARKLLPELPSRSLGALACYFDLQIESRHRAADDAVATAHLLLRLLGMLAERGIERWEDVEVLFGHRAPRRKRRASPHSKRGA